jgi:hypothetical protein
MFGATPVLNHSKFIHPILPDHGPAPTPDGMQRITPGNVMARIGPHLAVAASDPGCLTYPPPSSP